MSDSTAALGLSSLLGIGGLLFMIYKTSEDDNDIKKKLPKKKIPRKHSGIKLSPRKYADEFENDNDEFENDHDEFENNHDEFENDEDDEFDEDDEDDYENVKKSKT